MAGFAFKPMLSGENSVILSLAAAALVTGIYSQKLGPVSDAHATDANDGNMKAALKKAGWEAVMLVGAMWLLARDHNIAILGGAAIIAEELSYRHAIMTEPGSGQIQITPASYQAASSGATVTPINAGLAAEAYAG